MFTKAFLLDLLERAGKAFVGGFLAAVVAGLGLVHDVPTAKALVVGAFTAGISAVLSVLSLGRSNTVSPASVVKAPEA